MKDIMASLENIERLLEISNRLIAYHITHAPKQDEGYAEMMKRDLDVLDILAGRKEGCAE